MTDVLVFVPGTIGSELFDGLDRIWPGTLFEAIGGLSDAKFQKLQGSTLTPGDIIRDAAGGLVPVYRPWIKAFEGIVRGGAQLFRENPPAGSPKTLFPFPYDWRLDLRDTAKLLSDFLDGIVAGLPAASIKLVCHSQGGMVGRFYLESGAFDQKPGFAAVSAFVTFGTPHNGAPVAFAAAVGLHKAQFLSKAQTKTLANSPMCPSLYQLFPEVRHSFIWNSKSSNSTVPTDDSTLGVQVGLNPSHMNAWKAFRQGLTNNRPANVRYAYIVGSRQETITRFIWDGAKSLRVEEIEDAGDGTVSLLGAMDIGTQTDFVGKSHVTLIETKPARETLASVFGGTTTFDVPAITLDVRYLAVSTIDPVHVQIGLNGADQVKGKLSFQRADIPDTNAPPNAPEFVDVSFVTTLPVSVTSAGIEFLNIKCPPITVAGIYRPKFVDDGGGPPALGPKFVVQKND